jgi:integrase
VIFLLSLKAVLRAKEVASLTWGMITAPEGNLSDAIRLTDAASKGKSSGMVYMGLELKAALTQLRNEFQGVKFSDRVIQTERQKETSAQAVLNLFQSWYRALGFEGCSSHSGRRTFITNAARKVSTVGGSIRDVQMLARHSTLSMNMCYIDFDKEAMRKVFALV